MIVITFANIVILAAISYMLWKKEKHEVKVFFWPALILKLCAGIALGLLYQDYYTVGDTLGYFRDGKLIAHVAHDSWQEYLYFLLAGTNPEILTHLEFVEPRALFFSRIASPFILLSGYNYWLTSCYFSLISFSASWYLVKEVSRYREHLSNIAVFAFLFFPSTVFWTSGLIKESAAMAGLFFTVAIFLRIRERRKVRVVGWIVLLVSIWMLWKLKYYYAAVLLPVLATELVMKLFAARFRLPRPWVRAVIWLAVFTIPLLVVSKTHPNFYPDRILDVIVANHDLFVSISDPGDVVHFESLRPEMLSVLRNAPKAMIAGAFRPFFWEAENVVQWCAALENLLLLILAFGFMIGAAKSRSPDPLFFQTLLFCVLLCVLLTLSAPNFGTLSRYRVGFLPFFVMLIGGQNYFLSRLHAGNHEDGRRLVP